MIIKSMSRKEPSFDNLLNYMLDEKKHTLDKDYIFTHNLFSTNKLDKEKIINQFMENHKLLKKRKNGNSLYHEVISIKKNENVSDKIHKEALSDVVSQYIQDRAGNCLVYGIIHEEKGDNLHFHLMISSNQLDQTKRFRLTKKNFTDIEKRLEIYIIQKYPELKQKLLFNKKKKRKTKTRKEFEFEKRTGLKSNKSTIKETLEEIFKHSKTKDEFENNLSYTNLELVKRRNKITGVKNIQTKFKSSLKNIGIEEEFKSFRMQLEEFEKKEQQPQARKQKTMNPYEEERIKEENRKAYERNLEKGIDKLVEEDKIMKNFEAFEKNIEEEANDIWEEQERIKENREAYEKEVEENINRKIKEAYRKKDPNQDMEKEEENIKELKRKFNQNREERDRREEERIKQEEKRKKELKMKEPKIRM